MFIIKERYLEVPNFQNWTEGLYLVDAPCGTGKSYFVFHTLYPFAKENNKKLIVFSNRNALKRQQELQAEGTDYPIPANGVVHHIDGDSLDNRICNLQAITKEEHDKVQGGFQIAVELKVVDATTFARGGYNWPCTTMQGFERRDKAAEFLNLSIKEFDNLLKRKPEKMFGDTKAWHAPDGRIVLKFPKRYLTKDDLQYFEN